MEKDLTSASIPKDYIKLKDYARECNISEESLINDIRKGVYLGRIIKGHWYVKVNASGLKPTSEINELGDEIMNPIAYKKHIKSKSIVNILLYITITPIFIFYSPKVIVALLEGNFISPILTIIAFLLFTKGMSNIFYKEGELLMATYANSADETLKKDNRPPILYLRSFKDDDSSIGILFGASIRMERIFVNQLSKYGPCIAVGEPGENLPDIGASRAYFANHQWKNEVNQLMKTSELVFFHVGDTGGLAWEIKNLFECDLNKKAIFYIPHKNSENYYFLLESLTNIIMEYRNLPPLLVDNKKPMFIIFSDKKFKIINYTHILFLADGSNEHNFKTKKAIRLAGLAR